MIISRRSRSRSPGLNTKELILNHLDFVYVFICGVGSDLVSIRDNKSVLFVRIGQSLLQLDFSVSSPIRWWGRAFYGSSRNRVGQISTHKTIADIALWDLPWVPGCVLRLQFIALLSLAVRALAERTRLYSRTVKKINFYFKSSSFLEYILEIVRKQ